MADEGNQRRQRRGRQKIAMVKMENESNLQVTFSKRRTGLFKKASELCTLCGAEIALVVFSPGKKVFSFGHPSVDAVLDRYAAAAGLGLGAAAAPEAPPAALELIEAHRSASLRDLNMQLMQISAQVDTERKRGDALTRQRRVAMAHLWWEAPVERIDDEGRLLELRRALEDLKAAVTRRADRLVVEASAAYYGGAGGRHGNGVVVPYSMGVVGSGYGSDESSPSSSETINEINNNQFGSYRRNNSGFY